MSTSDAAWSSFKWEHGLPENSVNSGERLKYILSKLIISLISTLLTSILKSHIIPNLYAVCSLENKKKIFEVS